MQQDTSDTSAYMQKYNGKLVALRHWSDLEQFWETLLGAADDGWYVYAVGEPPPVQPVSRDELAIFVREVDALLRQDHDEDYCGIVYVDDRNDPGFVKIYDPNNLGSSCGSSGKVTLPGWTLSRAQPDDLQVAFPLPANRRRWWQRLFT